MILAWVVSLDIVFHLAFRLFSLQLLPRGSSIALISMVIKSVRQFIEGNVSSQGSSTLGNVEDPVVWCDPLSTQMVFPAITPDPCGHRFTELDMGNEQNSSAKRDA